MKPQDLYAQLELIAPPSPDPTTARLSPVAAAWTQVKAQLHQVGQSMLNYFCGSMEPQVSIRCDRTGQPHFQVYDPFDQRHHTFPSEEALRIWLEQRYYQ